MVKVAFLSRALLDAYIACPQRLQLRILHLQHNRDVVLTMRLWVKSPRIETYLDPTVITRRRGHEKDEKEQLAGDIVREDITPIPAQKTVEWILATIPA